MDYQKAIKDLCSGDQIEGFYLLKSAAVKNSTSGRPFLSAVIADCTSEIEAKLWDYSGDIHSCTGSIIKIRGDVSEYKGALQLTIHKTRTADGDDSYPAEKILPSAPIDKEAEVLYVQNLISSLSDDDYRKVCEEMLHRHLTRISVIPAGKTIHHAFLGGLLMHTSNMLRIADYLSEIYSDTVDRSLLLSGTLLHDFAKSEEFLFSSCSIVTEYSLRGQLVGHLVLGAEEIARVCDELSVPEEKSILLQHLILSHHGEPEFGAAVRPLCAESELLSLIDQIDSKMEIYREVIKTIPAGSFSQKIYALDKKIYHHNDT